MLNGMVYAILKFLFVFLYLNPKQDYNQFIRLQQPKQLINCKPVPTPQDGCFVQQNTHSWTSWSWVVNTIQTYYRREYRMAENTTEYRMAENTTDNNTHYLATLCHQGESSYNIPDICHNLATHTDMSLHRLLTNYRETN